MNPYFSDIAGFIIAFSFIISLLITLYILLNKRKKRQTVKELNITTSRKLRGSPRRHK